MFNTHNDLISQNVSYFMIHVVTDERDCKEDYVRLHCEQLFACLVLHIQLVELVVTVVIVL